jgi:hypothetical protein
MTPGRPRRSRPSLKPVRRSYAHAMTRAASSLPKAVLNASTARRDRLAAKLSAANATTAQVEGNTIASTSEFAAVQFIARRRAPALQWRTRQS